MSIPEISFPESVEQFLDRYPKRSCERDKVARAFQFILENQFRSIARNTYHSIAGGISVLNLGANRYCINTGAVIGKGGSKSVYKGILYHSKNHTIRRVVHAVGEDFSGFVHEKEVATLFPNKFVPVHGIVCDPGRRDQHLVTDRYDGTLEDLIATRRNSFTEATPLDKISIAIQVAEDLNLLHQKVFHGDIAAWNILLKRKWNDEKKLVTGYTAHLHDFGFAYKVEEKPLQLLRRKGNVFYFPPEVIEFMFLSKGKCAEICSKKWEVWSLGKVIQELLCPTMRLSWPGYFSLPSRSCTIDDLKRQQGGHGVVSVEKIESLLARMRTPISVNGTDYIQPLVASMLNADPSLRPPLNAVIQTLRSAYHVLFMPVSIRSFNLGDEMSSFVARMRLFIQRNQLKLGQRQCLYSKNSKPKLASTYEGDFYILTDNRERSGRYKKLYRSVVYHPGMQSFRLALCMILPRSSPNDEIRYQNEMRVSRYRPHFDYSGSVYFFGDRYNLTLEKIVMQFDQLSKKEFARIAGDVVGQIKSLHFQGFYHGNLSLKKVLLEEKRVQGKDVLTPLLNDFRYTFRAEEFPDRKELFKEIECRLAPEMRRALHSDTDGSDIDFAKCDIWRLGHLFSFLKLPDRLIQRMIAQDPIERPSLEEVAEELRHYES